MILTNLSLIETFVRKHSDSVKSINKWLKEVCDKNWKNHAELKLDYPSADYVGNSRYVFNISGNKYRIVAVVIFINGVMDLRFIGTHAEYDRIDCSTI